MFKDLKDYSNLVKYEIFNINENIQFQLLFEDFSNLLNYLNCKSYCLIERSHLYEGKSIFAPLINDGVVRDIVDYRPSEAKFRKSSSIKTLKKFYKNLPSSTSVIYDDERQMKFSGKTIDSEVILIPNVVHHCRDLNQLIELILKESKGIKFLYIFDSYLREEHQEPNDYLRFTVSGLKSLMEKYEFKLVKKELIGNIFDGLLYLINQAEKMEKKFKELESISHQLLLLKEKLLPIANIKKYQKLYREYASFSTAYSVLFKKS